MNSYNNIVSEIQSEYKKIGDVSCVILKYEKVRFNSLGFKHIIRKGISLRKPKDVLIRLNLLKYCPLIIQSADVFVEYRLIKKRTKSFEYWGLTKVVSGKEVTVVIRQAGNGLKHFYSVFIRRTSKKYFKDKN